MRFADAIVTGTTPIRYPDSYALTGGIENTPEKRKALRNAIADAVPLEASSICQYAFTNTEKPWIPMLKGFPQVLPWKDTFIDMKVENRTPLAVLVQRREVASSAAGVGGGIPVINEPTVWSVQMILFIRQSGVAIPFARRTYHLRRSDGTALSLCPREFLADPDEILNNLFTIAMVTVSLAGVFCNCKNVEVKEVVDAKVTRDIFRRKHGLPQVKYHTIIINPGAHGLYSDSVESDEVDRALHFCRGHFKRYDKKLLFGKIRGTFWVETHLRGKAIAGQSIADYSFPQAEKSV